MRRKRFDATEIELGDLEIDKPKAPVPRVRRIRRALANWINNVFRSGTDKLSNFFKANTEKFETGLLWLKTIVRLVVRFLSAVAYIIGAAVVIVGVIAGVVAGIVWLQV